MKNSSTKMKERKFTDPAVSECYNLRILLIKKLIQECHLSVSEFCDHVNVSPSTYYRYENLTTYISEHTYIHFCNFLVGYLKDHHLKYSDEVLTIIKKTDIFDVN